MQKKCSNFAVKHIQLVFTNTMRSLTRLVIVCQLQVKIHVNANTHYYTSSVSFKLEIPSELGGTYNDEDGVASCCARF